MPRRNHQQRRRGRAGTPATPVGSALARVESGADGEWSVRAVSGPQAAKTYRCPGCDHPIDVGVPHVVAWRNDDLRGAEDRRHWHNGCWAGRQRRGLTRRWS
ncbi:MAG: ATP/GTP-binding protein [Mycobacteriaceae bacterium]